MRAVSVLEVAEPALWAEIEAVAPRGWTSGELDATRRLVTPLFEREVLPLLRDRILVRYARRAPAAAAAEAAEVARRVSALRPATRRVLSAAQRHAVDGELLGRQTWDPVSDRGAVEELLEAGLVIWCGSGPAFEGLYRLHPDLPPAVEVPLVFDDAVLPRPTDLPAAGTGPIALIHDLASLAAAVAHHPPRVTHADTLSRTEARRIGRQLGDAGLAADGEIESHPRWGLALRALRGLAGATLEPVSRVLELDPRLEVLLAGETEDACDHLVHRLVDRDLHAVIPAVRAAVRAAGTDAIDELIFLELLEEQQRDILLPRWLRENRAFYPQHGSEPLRAYDHEGWEHVESRMIRSVLGRMARFGLLVRAEGVFAGTPDGRRWAGVEAGRAPPIWVSGDLEIIVPPDAITPWERFQIERLSRCLQRDTVDRYRIERGALATWMSTHDEEEMVALLSRRAPGLPPQVPTTLRSWAAAARRLVLTRGVLIDIEGGGAP